MANLAHPDVVDDDRPDAVDDDDDDVEEESHAVTLHSTMAPTFDVDMSCVAQSPSQCTTSGMPSGDSTLPESQSRGPSSSSPPSPSMRWRARRASMRHADVRSLVTATYTLDEFERAFEHAARPGALKILFDLSA